MRSIIDEQILTVGDIPIIDIRGSNYILGDTKNIEEEHGSFTKQLLKDDGYIIVDYASKTKNDPLKGKKIMLLKYHYPTAKGIKDDVIELYFDNDNETL
jgi:hypothetical protein